jgi:hypothetical protein
MKPVRLSYLYLAIKGAASLTLISSRRLEDLAPIPDITLEKLGADIEGDDKEGFFRWIRSALQWNPRGIKVQSKQQNPGAKS